MKFKKINTLIIAPTPPAWGGARVSAKLFIGYLYSAGFVEYEHVNLPFNRESGKSQSSLLNFKSAFYFLKLLFSTRKHSKVILFASRNTGMFYGSLLIIAGRFWNAPVYVRFFGGHPINSKFLKIPVLNTFILRSLTYAQGIVLETNSGASEFPEYLQKNISVIPGYRPSTDFKRVPRTIENNSKNTIRFLFVGSLSKEKGVELILEAFVILKYRLPKSASATMDLFGHGDQKFLEKYKMDNSICYHGSVENDKLRMQLPQYDVLVFSSVYENEGHPGVLIEAMMAGLAIIASSSTPSVLEVITHQVNGLIVPPGNVDSLSSAMELLTSNNALREALAEKALQDSEQYRSDVVLPRMARIFGLID